MSTPDTISEKSPATQSNTPSLYRHSKREEWGLGIIETEFDDRTTFIFQDGHKRTFKDEFYSLLERVDRPFDVSSRIIETLEAMSSTKKKRAGRKSKATPVSIVEQIAHFRTLFEDGFRGEAYTNHHRGDGRKRPLKRHRDAFIEACKSLSRSTMRKKLNDKDFTAVHEDAAAALNALDMVPAKERKAFSEISSAHHESVADTLFALLHGNANFATRFQAFSRAAEAGMDSAPSWTLTTALLAGVHPKQHMVVNQRTMASQAEWMAPGLIVAKRPQGVLYERLVAMVDKVQSEMEQAGLAPRDKMDVITFMTLTLSPSAKKSIIGSRGQLGAATAEAAEENAA